MTSLEQDIAEIKISLTEIKKALGIGMTAPANVVDIRRRAIADAETLKRKSNRKCFLNSPPISK
jgi:hypothetical protein